MMEYCIVEILLYASSVAPSFDNFYIVLPFIFNIGFDLLSLRSLSMSKGEPLETKVLPKITIGFDPDKSGQASTSSAFEP